MTKDVIIIGDDKSMLTSIEIKELIEMPVPDNSIEINGIKYVPIEQRKNRSSNAMVMIASAMIMSGISAGYSRERPNVNILEEFKLIQQKKSKLSKNDRDWVVYQFKLQYKEI